MRYHSFTLLSLASQALAHPKGCSSSNDNPTSKAAYTITNDKENAVLALPIQQNGMLGAGKLTKTGGAGANGIDSSNNMPASPDALFSQSSLTVAGNNLFAVNAGSNSLTMFRIDAQDPTKLTMVGSPMPVTGEFPVTVAASKKNGQVCVGSTGAKAGVSCSQFTAKGLQAMDALRPFNLGQTTPPVGPLNTVSQVFFSSDESTLFSTVKGDPTKNNTGFLAMFPVTRSGVSQQGANASPMGTAVLFGSSTIPGSSNLFVTDASFGGAVLSVGGSAGASVVGKGAVDGQKATCWATISPATKTAFVTDVGTNRLVEMSVNDAKVLGQIDLSANGDPGLIDLKAEGNFIYALSPGNGTTEAAITVVDASSKKQVQHLTLGAMGAGKNSMGMAISN